MLVTRAAAQATPLAAALAAKGASVACVGVLRFVPARDPGPIVTELRRLSQYDFVILTSANAATEMARVAREAGIDLASGLAGGALVAAGPATAAALEQAGLPDVLVPREFSARGIASLLGEAINTGWALLPRAEEALPWLPAWLTGHGVEVVELGLYRTETDPDAREPLHRELARGLDVISFASPSAVDAFVELAPEAWALPPGSWVACIGPTTAAAARRAGLEPVVTATEHSAAGLASAISDHLA